MACKLSTGDFLAFLTFSGSCAIGCDVTPEKATSTENKLREKSKFQQFEGKLSQRGKRLGKVRVLFDETNKLAILGLANEGSEEKVTHQVRIKLKADKDDEPEENAEPAIQATACGQATGEAVPTEAAMQPLAAPPGGGDFEGGYEGPQICTSQWGYDYLCLSRTPAISLSTSSLAVPQTFITQQTQASFVIWNSGGGTLTGTVTTSAPFSIVSGGSFSLSPGQPQEVVIKFSSATPGSFSKGVSISSNGGSKTVTATSAAHKVSFSPAQVDFGSGLLVLREQCNQMGTCELGTEKVGLPIEKQLTVKNEGTVSVTLTLSTSAPYSIVSVLPTLSPGQSGQVTVRFDPNESGSFTGNVQVGINGGQGSVSSPPLVGVAHKIEISPTTLDFGIVILNNPKQRRLTIKNEGTTTANLTLGTSQADLEIISGNMLNLASGAEQVVKLRFSPTAPGVFQRSLSVAAGTSTVNISASGKVYNSLEEYLQELLQAYNQQRQECYTSISTTFNDDCGIGAIGTPISDRDEFWLVGFNELTPAQVINYQGMASSYSVPDTFVERLVELAGLFVELDNLDPDLVASWYQRLWDALAAGRFDEEYALLLQDAQFARYHQLLGQLIETTDAEQIRAFLQRAVQLTTFQLEQPQPGYWGAFLERLLNTLVREGHLTQAQADALMANARAAASKIGGLDGLMLMDAVTVILGQFHFAKQQFASMPELGQMPSYAEFATKLNFILEQINRLSGNHKTNETIKAWLDKLIVAARGVMQGWLIMNILVDLDSNQANTDPNGRFIDIVAWKMIDNTRVVAFLKVESRFYRSWLPCPTCGIELQYYNSLFSTLSAMINHVRLSANTLQQYGYGLYMIGVIFTHGQDAETMNTVAEKLAKELPEIDSSMFVALFFYDRGTRRYTVIIICPSGGCSPTMIRAGGDAACDFLAARIQSANLSGITHTCADGTEIDIKTINQQP